MRNPNPHVIDIAAPTAELPVEARASTAAELLVGAYALTSPANAREPSWAPAKLSQCRSDVAGALRHVGERSGEVWLHLLGVVLDARADSAQALLERLDELDPIELRRHLVGVYVPAWCQILGKETLERAAAGDAAASRELVAERRYYAGRASESLAPVLQLAPKEAKRRVVHALRLLHEAHLAPQEAELAQGLRTDAAAKAAHASSVGGYAAIDAAAGGYLYETEPEFTHVVLIPHLAANPWLLLCQHRDARLICYAVADPTENRPARLARLGRALADPGRVAILDRLRSTEATLAELADEIGLAKSTTHHHLAQLRAAKLVNLRGNAAGYRYALDEVGFAEARQLLRFFSRG